MINAVLAKESHRSYYWFADGESWIAQPKINGQRLLLRSEKGKLSGFNRHGEELNVSKLNIDIQKDCLLDGEYISETNEYYVFDLLKLDSITLHQKSLKRRLYYLKQNFSNLNLVPSAQTQKQKYWLWQETLGQGHEGLVFKNMYDQYNSETKWFKYKHYKTVDAFVLETNRGGKQQAITVGLYDDNGNEKEIGGCKIPMSLVDNLKLGQVVEIQYQHATKSGQLYIPKFQHVRLDKPKETCYTSQLQYENTNIIKEIQIDN